MNNYLKKYSNYFLGLGGLLLLMYFLDVVPYRFRNAPESLRLFFPIILIIIGLIGKFLDNNNSNFHQSSQNSNDQLNYQNSTVFEKDIIKETHSGFSNQESNSEITNMSPNDWIKQNPGKSLNDYYVWKQKNIAQKDTPIESDSKEQQYFNKNQYTNRNPNINENLVKDEFRIDKKGLTYLYKKEDIENFIKEGKISSSTKIWKRDWYEWKCVKDTEFNYLLRKETMKFNVYPYIIGILIGIIFIIIKYPHLVNHFANDTSENTQLTNYDTGEVFEVANEDLEIKMTQEEAEYECSQLGNGWRLPSISELKIIYEELHKVGLGEFKDETYWSSDGYDFDFAIGSAPYNPNILPQDLVRIPKWVRAVRSLKIPSSKTETIIIEKQQQPSYSNKCDWCGKGFNGNLGWGYFYCSKSCYYTDPQNNR